LPRFSADTSLPALCCHYGVIAVNHCTPSGSKGHRAPAEEDVVPVSERLGPAVARSFVPRRRGGAYVEKSAPNPLHLAPQRLLDGGPAPLRAHSGLLLRRVRPHPCRRIAILASRGGRRKPLRLRIERRDRFAVLVIGIGHLHRHRRTGLGKARDRDDVAPHLVCFSALGVIREPTSSLRWDQRTSPGPRGAPAPTRVRRVVKSESFAGVGPTAAARCLSQSPRDRVRRSSSAPTQ